ncbi:MAG: hypothetical protein H7258_09240 [Ferruginibacter sp.]|nr:hypothetical protein [Ferruginibacter sp.]
MTDLISNDFTAEEPQLPTGLKVLTILTIIGTILFSFIGGVWGYFSAQKNYDKTKDLLDSGKMNDAPGWAKGMISPEMLDLQQKALENKLPILILTLVAGALCLYGALEMRKRKKQGYIFWLIGELLPIAATVLFLGSGAVQGFGLFALFIPLVFIILYTVNRKELIY